MKTFSTSGTGNQQTLSEIESDKMPIYDSVADAEADLANLEEGQLGATKDTGDELSQPVDKVEIGNLHAVTSNAVDKALEWKALSGTDTNDIADCKEINIVVWGTHNGEEFVYSNTFPRQAISLSFNQKLLIGGYYWLENDYGCCSVTNTAGVISILGVKFNGQTYTSEASIAIRYR